MKMKKNNYLTFTFRIFLALFFVSFLFLPLSSKAQESFSVCAPKEDECAEYSIEIERCEQVSGCRKMIGVYSAENRNMFSFCASIEDPYGCYKVLAANCLDTAERQKHCQLVDWNTPVLASGSGIQDEEPTPDFSSLPTFTNPMNIDSPQTFIGKIINIIMGVVGSIALIMFIFGGITWMTAGGNEQKVKKGVGILVWSVIGLVAIFLSYAIVNILLKQVA